MPRVVHFEIHADEPERSAAFYRRAFGWEIKKWDCSCSKDDTISLCDRNL